MAKYVDRLNELLNEGTITQDQFDELADLSIAKEAIKEGNDWKRRAETAEATVQKFETAPKRKEAWKLVGIDYDNEKQYGRDALDSYDGDLDDTDALAAYATAKGFEATISSDAASGEKSGAEKITDSITQFGSGQPVRVGAEAAEADFLADLDKVPDGNKEALTEVLKKHNRHQQSGDWEMASQG